MNKAEGIAKYLVDQAYELFIYPGKYKEKSFNKDTFDIKEYIIRFISLSYIRKVPIKSMKHALTFGEKYWNEKIANYEKKIF